MNPSREACEPIAPGATIGILGGGQLGRMLAMAAAQLGYRSHVYAPEASGPATEVAARWTCAGYDDPAALARFATEVDAITYEFENIDPAAVARLAAGRRCAPPVQALEVSRYRPNEKQLVAELGGRTAPWAPVASRDDLDVAIVGIGLPAILKTCSLGYDGKGQWRLASPADVDAAWDELGGREAIVEGRIDFLAEFSVLLCRGADGVTVAWDLPENLHRAGILHRSTVPARAGILAQADEALTLGRAIAERLAYVGVLAVEFFATADGPLFNEMAPRVHNSGHWTIEGAVTSQFENHIRALCGLPLGSTARRGGRIEMENLIGDEADRWPALLADPAARLHLYGKKEARPGRKMGHVTWVG